MSQTASDNGLPTEEFEDDLSIDVYEALTSERRRHVLAILSSTEETLSLEALARRVAASESGEPPEAVTADRSERVHLSLYHNHVPKLADMGLVDYDVADKTVHGLTVSE